MAAAMAVVAEDSIGPAGALTARGLVPLPAAERVALRERVLEMGGAL
ncbi:MAG: hypothetical protein IT561_10935 [Alphaproteobacteria bacterium]|nr:hypothetical protein [Alphaproteobacteria bacterium]